MELHPGIVFGREHVADDTAADEFHFGLHALSREAVEVGRDGSRIAIPAESYEESSQVIKTMFGFSAATVRVAYPARITIAMWNGRRSRIECSIERR